VTCHVLNASIRKYILSLTAIFALNLEKKHIGYVNDVYKLIHFKQLFVRFRFIRIHGPYVLFCPEITRAHTHIHAAKLFLPSFPLRIYAHY